MSQVANASKFDEHEPAERLPRFPKGKYLATVDKVVYIDPDEDEKATGEYLIVEFTVNSSEGPEALKPGDRAKVMEQFDVRWRKYPTERAKNLTYALLDRRSISGAELLDLWRGNALVGRPVKITVVPQTDKDGELKTDAEGNPYMENHYSVVRE